MHFLTFQMPRKRLLAQLRVDRSKVALWARQGDIFEESAFAPQQELGR